MQAAAQTTQCSKAEGEKRGTPALRKDTSVDAALEGKSLRSARARLILYNLARHNEPSSIAPAVAAQGPVISSILRFASRAPKLTSSCWQPAIELSGGGGGGGGGTRVQKAANCSFCQSTDPDDLASVDAAVLINIPQPRRKRFTGFPRLPDHPPPRASASLPPPPRTLMESGRLWRTSSAAHLKAGETLLDKLLDSGLYTGEITELSGGPGAGKSQVCFAAAVHTAHRLRQSVIYVDTAGGLSAGRLLQMLRVQTDQTEEQMEALQRIRVFRVFDIFSLLGCLHDLRCGGLQQASLGGGSVKAVIVDSVSAIISPTLGGKQNEGMSLMMQVAGTLKTIAKDFNVAVLVTNHVTRGAGGEVLAGLGLSWSHVPRTRVLLERSEGRRTATLVKSSRQPCRIKAEFDFNRESRPGEGRLGGERATGS
ncbi:DNA repair protein RAD51 4 [Merluccius polli]|uniref:DNA repair protein RAD51 4 n=1 Tax=Merluccius polli TaxID=89951 RepID=A0AA47MDB7_MERPO|nr:DNA repair protein RAD51 4 [Merluccius polli]